MNKNMIFISAFVAVLLIGGGVFMFMNRSIETDQGLDLESTDSSMMQESDTDGKSIRDLMTMTNSMTCTYRDIENNSKGTVYVSNGHLRGDFEVDMEGTTVNSHMITSNDTVYIWSDDSDQGVMFSTENIEEVNSDEGRPNAVDVEEEFDYDCRSWRTDDSQFEVPDDIEFIDFGEMMTPNFNMNTGDQPVQGTSDQCAACESLSGDSKEQCLQSLGC